jgi:hypothetical protein
MEAVGAPEVGAPNDGILGYRLYWTGKPGVVEIELRWTARARERLDWQPQARIKKTTPL